MVQAVRAAGRICRSVQSSLTAEDSIRKDDRSPVTVADLATQAVIARRLADAFPDLPLVGEEDSGVLDGEERRVLAEAVLSRVRAEWPDADERSVREAIDLGRAQGDGRSRYFTLDPIDGTKGFLRLGQYATALALIEDGRVVAGVLGYPNLASGDVVGTILFAARGVGTRVLPVDGETLHGRAVRVSTQSDPSRMRLCESVESGHSDRATSSALIARLGVLGGAVRMDSQAKYAVIATGEAELYLRAPTKPGRSEWIWDHAAGAICVEEAGGVVTDLDGAPLDFGRGRTLSANRGVVADNGHLHEKVLEALAAK
jgi:3'(2'), 5'-bisphosphate nucleotidase